MPPKAFDVEQAAALLCISRSRLYELMKAGEIQYILIGRLRRIRPEAIDEFLNRLSSSQRTSEAV
jgi:excisionase family DNA binding protein